MYVLKNKHKSPGYLLNTISNDKYASMSPDYQHYYEYLLGEVKKDMEEESDHIEIRPDILGQSEIIHVSNQLFKANNNEAGSNHQNQTS